MTLKSKSLIVDINKNNSKNYLIHGSAFDMKNDDKEGDLFNQELFEVPTFGNNSKKETVKKTAKVDYIKDFNQKKMEMVSSKPKQLPLIPIGKMQIPNGIIRYNFCVENRIELKEPVVHEYSGGKVIIYNNLLTPFDCDVFSALIKKHSKEQKNLEDDYTAFTIYELYKHLDTHNNATAGRLPNGDDYRRIEESLEALSRSGMKFIVAANNQEQEVGFNFISTIHKLSEIDAIGEKSRIEYQIRFNKDFASLFETNYSSLDVEVRKKLGRNDLAKILHQIYCSHQGQIFKYSVSTWHKKVFSPIKSMPKFKQKLGKALERLVEAGFAEYAHIDNKNNVLIQKRVDFHVKVASK